ncbi:MAG: hypothetical protein Q8880_05285 [Bacteroidota bacterium]|nr:hypothetical protein [Bacteroidota bacterium]
MKGFTNNHSFYLLVGFIVGIAFGSTIAWFINNKDTYHYISDRTIGKLVNDFKKVPDFISNIDLYPFSKKRFDKKDDFDISDSELFKNNSNYSIPGESLSVNKKNKSNFYYDTLYSDSSTYLNDFENIDRNVIIKKDELIVSRIIRIEGVDIQKNRHNRLLDSLLTDENDDNIYSDKIIVEFWKSPLNYKGYKMTRTKLVLFGLTDYDDITIRYVRNNYFLHSGNTKYKLLFNDNFMPLIPAKE